MFNKTEFKLLLIRYEYGQRIIYAIKNVKNPTNPIVKIGGNKSLTVDFSNPTYISKNKRFYMMDIEKNAQITLKENCNILKSEELDNIIGNDLVKQIAKGVIDDKIEKLIYIGVGLIIGGLIGYIIAQTLMQNKIDELNSNKTIIPINSGIKIIWDMIKFVGKFK